MRCSRYFGNAGTKLSVVIGGKGLEGFVQGHDSRILVEVFRGTRWDRSYSGTLEVSPNEIYRNDRKRWLADAIRKFVIESHENFSSHRFTKVCRRGSRW